MVPTATLPNASELGLDPNAPGAVPVPDSGMANVESDAFDAMLIFPLALPADVGVKVTLKFALCPDVSVSGAVIPLRLNPVPLIAT